MGGLEAVKALSVKIFSNVATEKAEQPRTLFNQEVEHAAISI
jgi:hypothetical protein